MEANEKFPTLTTMARVAKTVGWIFVGLGLVGLLIGVVNVGSGLAHSGSRRSASSMEELFGGGGGSSADAYMTAIPSLLGGVFALFGGFVLVICAEWTAVFFEIERNTRSGATYLGGGPEPKM